MDINDPEIETWHKDLWQSDGLDKTDDAEKDYLTKWFEGLDEQIAQGRIQQQGLTELEKAAFISEYVADSDAKKLDDMRSFGKDYRPPPTRRDGDLPQEEQNLDDAKSYVKATKRQVADMSREEIRASCAETLRRFADVFAS